MRSISPNRITSGGATVVLLVLVAALAGCGGGGSSTTTATEAASVRPAVDGEVLGEILARQQGAVAAYAEVIPSLGPRAARMAAYFRAQEQEHVDATTKALRGLGAPATTAAEQIEVGELETDEERLLFIYELESRTVDEELSAISKFEESWPRSLLASTVADQAQHLTLLRQALGAGPLASVPAPFEDGTTPPPEYRRAAGSRFPADRAGFPRTRPGETPSFRPTPILRWPSTVA